MLIAAAFAVAALPFLFAVAIGSRFACDPGSGPFEFQYHVQKFYLQEPLAEAPTDKLLESRLQSGAIQPMNDGSTLYASVSLLRKTGKSSQFRISASARPHPAPEGGELGSITLEVDRAGNILRKAGDLTALDPSRLFPPLPLKRVRKGGSWANERSFMADDGPKMIELTSRWARSPLVRLDSLLPRRFARIEINGAFTREAHGDFKDYQPPEGAESRLPPEGSFDIYMELFVNGEAVVRRKTGRFERYVMFEQTNREFSMPDADFHFYYDTLTRWEARPAESLK